MKIEHKADYITRRAAEYPPITDYLDAKAKQSSDDPAMAADGAQQEADYLAACMAVKAKYKKG